VIPTNSPIKSNGNSKLTAELFEAGGVAVGEAKSAISAEPTAGQIEFGVNTRSKSLFDRHCRPRAAKCRRCSSIAGCTENAAAKIRTEMSLDRS